MPAHGEIRRIDLQNDARTHDSLVLGSQGRSQGLEVLVLRAIEVVGLKESDNSRGCGIHEGPHGMRRGGRRIQIRDIHLQRPQVLDAHRTDAARAPVFRRGPTLRELAQESRKLDQVLPRLARRVAAEPGQAPRDVGGVADLAHLAVADQVDADLHLPTHHLGHGRGNDGVVASVVTRLFALAREQHLRHGLAARQAADVRRQDPVDASAHA